MRPILFSIILALSLNQGQDPPEAYPGQRDHAKPPDGWFCSHDSKEPAKRCACQKMGIPTKEDPVCEFGDGGTYGEDRRCAVFCHKSHCHCALTKCEHPSVEHDGHESSPVPEPPAAMSHAGHH